MYCIVMYSSMNKWNILYWTLKIQNKRLPCGYEQSCPVQLVRACRNYLHNHDSIQNLWRLSSSYTEFCRNKTELLFWNGILHFISWILGPRAFYHPSRQGIDCLALYFRVRTGWTCSKIGWISISWVSSLHTRPHLKFVQLCSRAESYYIKRFLL